MNCADCGTRDDSLVDDGICDGCAEDNQMDDLGIDYYATGPQRDDDRRPQTALLRWADISPGGKRTHMTDDPTRHLDTPSSGGWPDPTPPTVPYQTPTPVGRYGDTSTGGGQSETVNTDGPGDYYSDPPPAPSADTPGGGYVTHNEQLRQQLDTAHADLAEAESLTSRWRTFGLISAGAAALIGIGLVAALITSGSGNQYAPQPRPGVPAAQTVTETSTATDTETATRTETREVTSTTTATATSTETETATQTTTVTAPATTATP